MQLPFKTDLQQMFNSTTNPIVCSTNVILAKYQNDKGNLILSLSSKVDTYISISCVELNVIHYDGIIYSKSND